MKTKKYNNPVACSFIRRLSFLFFRSILEKTLLKVFKWLFSVDYFIFLPTGIKFIEEAKQSDIEIYNFTKGNLF